MTDMIAAVRPYGSTTAAYRIAKVSGTGATVSTIASPAAERSLTRPVVSSSGSIAQWDVNRGGSHDNPLSMLVAQWWINGELKPKPKSWFGCGHLEWHPDGKQMILAVWEAFSEEFRPWVFDGSVWAPYAGRGFYDYDPSFAPDGSVVAATKRDNQFGVWVGDRKFPTLGGKPFDPFVSPDGTKCVVLVMESPWSWRIDLIDLVSGKTSVLVPASLFTLNSAPRWIDNQKLLMCRVLPNDNMTWRPWTLTIDGKLKALWSATTAKKIGSVEYAHPI